MTSEKLLRLILNLLAFHSICVGLALITTPEELYVYFGYYPVTERFFPIQGGIFHIIMGIAYHYAGRKLDQETSLVYLTIFAKITATCFLLFFFICVRQIWMVLASGIVDGLMALLVYIVFKQFVRERAASQ